MKNPENVISMLFKWPDEFLFSVVCLVIFNLVENLISTWKITKKINYFYFIFFIFFTWWLVTGAPQISSSLLIGKTTFSMFFSRRRRRITTFLKTYSPPLPLFPLMILNFHKKKVNFTRNRLGGEDVCNVIPINFSPSFFSSYLFLKKIPRPGYYIRSKYNNKRKEKKKNVFTLII